MAVTRKMQRRHRNSLRPRPSQQPATPAKKPSRPKRSKRTPSSPAGALVHYTLPLATYTSVSLPYLLALPTELRLLIYTFCHTYSFTGQPPYHFNFNILGIGDPRNSDSDLTFQRTIPVLCVQPYTKNQQICVEWGRHTAPHLGVCQWMRREALAHLGDEWAQRSAGAIMGDLARPASVMRCLAQDGEAARRLYNSVLRRKEPLTLQLTQHYIGASDFLTERCGLLHLLRALVAADAGRKKPAQLRPVLMAQLKKGYHHLFFDYGEPQDLCALVEMVERGEGVEWWRRVVGTMMRDNDVRLNIYAEYI